MASPSKRSSASTSTRSKALKAVSEKNKPFRPYGAAEEVLYAKDDEVLLSGPAGTGKSRGVLEKLHIIAEKYAGARILILRKTRASLTDSALVTFEEKVVPAGHPILEGAQRAQRREYAYPNGSVIVPGGLDKPSKIMSTEWDVIYVQEAIECTENDIESASIRLRNGVVPYQQLLMDTNPDKPSHWLLQRCLRGQTRMIECRHEDNPLYWDHAAGKYTEAGLKYIVGKLEKLSGVRLQRYRYGKWVAAEGLIYDEFDAAVHVVDRFEIPRHWKRYLSIDFGFTNAFVCQWWAEDDDGRLWLYREIYHTKRLVEDHARDIARLSQGEPKFVRVVCDHDAEDRATLERHLGVATTAAKKDVSPGIQAVKTRLRLAGDGKPRIFYLRDSLVERDEDLVEAKKPASTVEEKDGYVWDKSANPHAANAQAKGEQPVKEGDHGMDAERYMVADRDLRRRIDVT